MELLVEYLGETEAASLLRLRPRTLSNWRVRGIGPPFVKIGGRVAYARADVIAWLSALPRRRSTSEHPKVA